MVEFFHSSCINGKTLFYMAISQKCTPDTHKITCTQSLLTQRSPFFGGVGGLSFLQRVYLFIQKCNGSKKALKSGNVFMPTENVKERMGKTKLVQKD